MQAPTFPHCSKFTICIIQESLLFLLTYFASRNFQSNRFKSSRLNTFLKVRKGVLKHLFYLDNSSCVEENLYSPHPYQYL